MSNSLTQVDVIENWWCSIPVPRFRVLLALFLPAVVTLVYAVAARQTEAPSTTSPARLSRTPSIKFANSSGSLVSLSDGRGLLTAFEGRGELRTALEQNMVEPLSLAAADFDEDGVPDLVSGYEYKGRGVMTLTRGNVDALYSNTPEAKKRKAEGAFTDAPFLSPAQVFDAPVAVDFLGAGDFDADGHWDVVIGSRSYSALFCLSGDGQGRFAPAREIPLPGAVTALVAGEINRRDGLTDLIVGIDRFGEYGVLVFEGPDGALRSSPETFNLPARVSAVGIGQLDNSYEYDFAVAAGNELRIVYGRDRKLSLGSAQQRTVPVARRQIQNFSSAIRSLALGDFKGNNRTDIALVTDDGVVHFLEQFQAGDKPLTNKLGKQKNWTQTEAQSVSGPSAIELARVIVSSSVKDDLVIRDAANQFRVLNQDAQQRQSIFAMERRPVAILPMRLNQDALQDLVILGAGVTSPMIMQSGVASPLTSFSNGSPVSISGSFGTPPVSAGPYPSIITVSGLSGTIEKVRVSLNGVSMSSFEQDIDILLAGPTGQKSLLMSDVDTTCVISNQTLTFDDDAVLNLEGFNCTNGTYKPKDNAPVDTFGAPAPAGPYAASLANFKGTDPNGAWSLYMVCDSNFLSGQTLSGGWTLFFGPDSPQTFVVTNTNTSGAGSLAQAINDANGHLGLDNITFNIPGPGPYTIPGILPAVTEGVSIDATTQPGFAGTPIIEKRDGGFVINGGGTLVRGFVINNGGGISLQKAGNNIIEGNHIGINVAGTSAEGPQGFNGITIDTMNNVVGGTTPAARNVIANVTHGIQFATFDDSPLTTSDDASNNLIQGNYIGVNAAGDAVIPISHACITSRSAPGSPSNTIGGTTAGARNVFGGGTFPLGVDLVYSLSNGYLVQGNYFGIDATGTKTFAGGNGDGVALEGGSHGNLIGGTTPAARNVISGAIFNGVFLRDSGTSNNLIQGNFIGTDFTGTKALKNGVGIRTIFNADSNTIGGATAAARNIVSGNNIAGIQFGEPTRGGAVNNVVQGNYIGADVTGNTPLPNGRTAFFDGDAGIVVPANSRGDRIMQNRIAYNKGAGIRITNVSGGDTNSIEIEIADNEIFANEGLGIDLGDKGITPNDPQDADGGANLQQNFPVLTSAVASAFGESVWERAGELGREMPDAILAAALTVNGSLNSTPNTNFTVHWYFSADAQCVTNQAASRPLAFGKIPDVITDNTGNAMFSIPFDFPNGLAGGIINCTATDPQGNTSEFSACFTVGTAPGPTPTPTPTPAPSPAPSPPTIFVEASTNNLAAVDSITFVRGPFTLATTNSFNSDQRTRIMFFTTNLGLPQATQPAINTLSVQVGGNSHAVESVGPNTTTGGSVIVFRLPDLSPGTYPLGIRLNGVNSTNTPNLTISASPNSPASAPKSNNAKLAKYLLFQLIDLFL